MWTRVLHHLCHNLLRCFSDFLHPLIRRLSSKTSSPRSGPRSHYSQTCPCTNATKRQSNNSYKQSFHYGRRWNRTEYITGVVFLGHHPAGSLFASTLTVWQQVMFHVGSIMRCDISGSSTSIVNHGHDNRRRCCINVTNINDFRCYKTSERRLRI